MRGFFRKIFGDPNEKEVKRLYKTVNLVNKLEDDMKQLSDIELKLKTQEFKERLANGETLEDILPEAFAVVREASMRTLKMRHFDVQILGGIVLHQGRIAEMKTGEGKTLAATLPAYLNALTGKGVHIVTVNDYLASRDSEWMGQIYKFLGLTVGLIVHGLDFNERKKGYNCDIVYGTNNEFGFDYLRDNMVIYKEQAVQRQLNYAIVDEVDSILIDEARTPLIISGALDQSTDMYYTYANLIPRLKKDIDFTIDEKSHTAVLTDEGVARVENILKIDNLYDEKNMEISHNINQALKAHTLMTRDKDYVVKDGQVIIVDEFTGRLMHGRRYSEGLHQAIEAKEGVKVERESQTIATITFQNYFRMYDKLAGMTGTAATEEEEFRKIYGLDVVVIPTNEPMIRKDYNDVIYKTELGKFKAVADEIIECYKEGQPVLVGTISIEKSEQLSHILKRQGIPHNVLNAKYHEKEAEIVAQAGRLGAVTIATNMAGRGTDILLGGNPEFLVMEELRRKGINPDELDEEKYNKIYRKVKDKCDEEHQRVIELGGLHIIGTERHESRRIDNQLRGRAGRQGDPGSSRFYVSLGDDLMRLFGGDNIKNIMEKVGMDDEQPVEHGLISKSIETAQTRVESRNFDIRKHVLEYDDVMNKQREVIYGQRRQVLEGEDLRGNIMSMLDEVISNIVDIYCVEGTYPEEWDLKGLLEYGEEIFLPRKYCNIEKFKNMTKDEIKKTLIDMALKLYNDKEKELGSETMREFERVVTLQVVDKKWMDHIDAMDQLKQGIGLRAYGQKDPVLEYKFEGYEMFQSMVSSIHEDIIRLLFKYRLKSKPKRKQTVKETSESKKSVENKPITSKKVGRNDPCPCNSGKKYKRCCGR